MSQQKMSSDSPGRKAGGGSEEFGNRGGKTTSGTSPRDEASSRSDMSSRVASTAQQATDAVKETASQAASTVKRQVKGLLDRQVASGADMAGQFADSVKRAADDLDETAPQLAGLVRGMASNIEGFADEIRDQSVDDLVRAATDFTRRKPALVFGLAALTGFFAYRTVRSAATASTNRPPMPGGRTGQSGRQGQTHGSQSQASQFRGA
jgi:hypothetical protein